MKLVASSLALLVATTALAAQDRLAGHFSEPTSIVFMNYANKQACEADNGVWNTSDSGDGWCTFGSENTLDVKLVSGSTYSIDVNTMGTNGNSCSFEGNGKLTGATITATSSQVPGCVVTVKFSDAANTAEVSNNDKCSDLCGAHGVWLEIPAAKRQR